MHKTDWLTNVHKMSPDILYATAARKSNGTISQQEKNGIKLTRTVHNGYSRGFENVTVRPFGAIIVKPYMHNHEK